MHGHFQDACTYFLHSFGFVGVFIDHRTAVSAPAPHAPMYHHMHLCVTTCTSVSPHAPLCHHMHLCVTTCTSVYRLHTHALGTSFVQDLPVLPSVADLVHMDGSDRMINSSVTLQLGLRLCCQYYICYVFRP